MTQLKTIALRRGLSLCIGLCLLAQALGCLGVFRSAAGEQRAFGWPFVDYALFHDAHFAGERISTWQVWARTASNAVYRLDALQPSGVRGLDVRELVASLQAQDEAATLEWCERFAAGMGEQLIELDWCEITYRLEHGGFQSRQEQSLAVFALDRPLFDSSPYPRSE